jgi:hypothetical protein
LQAQRQPDLPPIVEDGTAETPRPLRHGYWAVEIFGEAGWTARRTFLSGSIRTYDSYEQALDAAVAYWQRSDRPARPLWIGSLEAGPDAPTRRH